ncbi:VPLPA-CTERM sorting domain-containing protein [Candidatus Litorirhabdus singularis]|nr:VPLPA-CTERM sorting domain-containing protein [Candidatus Litorirhabdus singularis]
MKRLKTAIFISIFALSSGANAALTSRLDGQAIYDDVYDLTWYTTVFNGNLSSVSSSISNLDVEGITGWRLPDHNDQEYQTLRAQIGTGDSTLSQELFGGTLVDNTYFTGTAAGAFPFTDVWSFYWDRNLAVEQYSSNVLAGIAVQTGDIAAVPIPAAVWLFGSALLGLGAIKRKKS